MRCFSLKLPSRLVFMVLFGGTSLLAVALNPKLSNAQVDAQTSRILDGTEAVPHFSSYSFNQAIADSFNSASSGFQAPKLKEGQIAARFYARPITSSGVIGLNSLITKIDGQLATNFIDSTGNQWVSNAFPSSFAFDGENSYLSAIGVNAGNTVGGTYTDMGWSTTSRPLAAFDLFLPNLRPETDFIEFRVDTTTQYVAADSGKAVFSFGSSEAINKDNQFSNVFYDAMYRWEDDGNDGDQYALVVDSFMSDPNRPTYYFSRFNSGADPDIDGNNVSFNGSTLFSGGGGLTNEGLFKSVNGTISTVADLESALLDQLVDANRRLTFLNVDHSIDGSSVAFTVNQATTEIGQPIRTEGIAIATDLRGSLELVATRDSIIPEHGGQFTSFGDAAMDRGRIAFQGFGENGYQGIFVEHLGELFSIVDTNDLLDGKAIEGFRFDADGFDNGALAYTVRFADGSEGIYRSNLTFAVPEPAAAIVLLVVAAPCCLARRRNAGHLDRATLAKRDCAV